MGCFKSKYPRLDRASKMKKTALNKEITDINMKCMSTKAQRTAVLKSSQPPHNLVTVLTPPYSNFDRITDNIFLTSVGGMIEENVTLNRIKCIINTTFEAPNYMIAGIECIRVPVDDDPMEDLGFYFTEVSDKLKEIEENKGKAVVHCVAGVSRSVTFILAYLMRYKGMGLKDAFLYVRQRRAVIQPKFTFMQQLIEYEKRIRRTNTSKIIGIDWKGVYVNVPDFYVQHCPDLIDKEVEELKHGAIRKDKVMEEFSERSIL